MPTGKLPIYPQPGNQGIRRGASSIAEGSALFVLDSNAFLNAGTVAQGSTLTAVSQTANTLLGNPTGANAAAVTIPLGAGLFFNGGALLANYQAGTLTSFGTGLSLSGGVLSATAVSSQWTAGTVTTLGTELSISSGTIHANWRVGGTVGALGTALAINSNTLNVNIGSGLALSTNTIVAEMRTGTVVTSFGAGLTVTAGVLHT